MKNNKYTFIVNLTDAENEQDVIRNFTNAKIDAGVPITRKEYNTCMQYTADVFTDMCNEMIQNAANAAYTIALAAAKEKAEKETEKPEKKDGIFKKAWKKITGKK